MINRSFVDNGMPAVFGYLIILGCFIFGSFKLFEKIDYAIYFYLVTFLIIVLKLSNSKRNIFLKYCYNQLDYRKVRLIENVLVSIPFTIFSIYLKQFLFIPIFLLAGIVFSFINLKSFHQMTIPTPFSKKPFEFTIGFRNTFYIYIISIFILYKAIEVTNLNLGISSLISIFLIVCSYYSIPEPTYFVWNYNLNPNKFLIEKIRTSLIYITSIAFPFLVVLCGFFYDNINNILSFLIAGYLFLVTIILAKYSAYPDKMNIIQGILIAFSVYFPPLLVIVIPFFYYQSLKQLNLLLK